MSCGSPTTPAGGRPPETATIQDLVDRAPRSLDHALGPIEIPTVPPAPRKWTLRVIRLPNGKLISEQFGLLHQYCVWGSDLAGGATEKHFLTQALDGSTLRT